MKCLKQGKITYYTAIQLDFTKLLNLQFTIGFKNLVISAIRAQSDKLSRVEQTYNLDLFRAIQVSCSSQKLFPFNLGKA